MEESEGQLCSGKPAGDVERVRETEVGGRLRMDDGKSGDGEEDGEEQREGQIVESLLWKRKKVELQERR